MKVKKVVLRNETSGLREGREQETETGDAKDAQIEFPKCAPNEFCPQ